MTLTEQALAANPDLAGIFGADASNPIGAARAVSNAGLSGKVAIVVTSPLSVSTTAREPFPDSRTQSLPSCQRGECGMDRPEATTRSVVTSTMTPDVPLDSRQPWAVFVRARAVT